MRCPDASMPVVGGTFRMGSSEGDPDERPVHETTVTSFCIDATEVTVEAYRECVADGACRPAQADDLYHTFRPRRQGRRTPEYHPINGVSWEDAHTYCASRGGRLPTEAEWEYAARGADGRVFPWGNSAPSLARAWYSPHSMGRSTSPVGGFSALHVAAMGELDLVGHLVRLHAPGPAPPGYRPFRRSEGASPFGALDMAGNVWEWVADWYDAYSQVPILNPPGPSMGTHRVLRGGGAGLTQPRDMRAANRIQAVPTSRSIFVGFRCARAGLGPRLPVASGASE